MLEIGKVGLVGNSGEEVKEPLDQLRRELAEPTDERLLKIVKALKQGISVDEIFQLTGIDRWYLYKYLHIIEIEKS